MPDLINNLDLLRMFMDASKEPGKFELFETDRENYEDQINIKMAQTD